MPVPNVQWKTPDDGQRNCPKHVEFRTRINLEISASIGLIVKDICYDARSYELNKNSSDLIVPLSHYFSTHSPPQLGY